MTYSACEIVSLEATVASDADDSSASFELSSLDDGVAEITVGVVGVGDGVVAVVGVGDGVGSVRVDASDNCSWDDSETSCEDSALDWDDPSRHLIAESVLSAR